jgi:ABC-type bacteriocin/lantibiotic exporter with double-glycine peptidase domain
MGAQKIIEKNNFKPSSGEKQRLILARALVGNPEFLVLDEALSAIDKKNYHKIEQKLLKFFPRYPDTCFSS